ncbi:hypothetical protein BWQ96_02840 [Gracilariopsis chorda]|uniref:Uncharacterized protein n=1 Tax=Gracilariopsis chorda TaxID=448386 RepID=A0A2V3J1T5_9FLOR|nr:hypothetical protein BWQ96_02840 [Gracilariopsis chorda]|eukprot:PXF47360.1 hypothetical protein BWQ96_02840 [Gracilariopsis chorda]
MSTLPSTQTPSAAPRRVALPAVVVTPLRTPRRIVPPSRSATTTPRSHTAPRRVIGAVSQDTHTPHRPRTPTLSASLAVNTFRGFDFDADCSSEGSADVDSIQPIDIISSTPSKRENDDWLRAFGIDISLLNLYDSDEEQPPHSLICDENHHPNITPTSSRQCTVPDAYELRPVHNPPSAAHTAVPRRSEQLSIPESSTSVTPRRLHLSSRRQSMMISQRELGSLAAALDLEPLNSSSSQSSHPVQMPLPTAKTSKAGTNVFLTPVRASRKQRAQLGADTIVTPVRRSLRLTRNTEQLVPIDEPKGRARMLEAFDFAYTPNRNLH